MDKTDSAANGRVPLVADVDEEAGVSLEGRRHRYTLPTLRYVSLVLALIFIDGIVSVVLWLVGGNSDYFVDNITHFHLKESVFDLALVSAAKVILHSPLISYLESVTLSQIQDPFNRSLNTMKHILHIVHILFSLAVLGYSTTKGGLILNAYLHEADYVVMHPTYNALVISTVAFTLVELGLFIYSYRAMRRLKVIRILHLYNDDGQEVDKDGNPVKKKVDIIRLISLAKPVSTESKHSTR